MRYVPSSFVDTVQCQSIARLLYDDKHWFKLYLRLELLTLLPLLVEEERVVLANMSCSSLVWYLGRLL